MSGIYKTNKNDLVLLQLSSLRGCEGQENVVKAEETKLQMCLEKCDIY